MKNNFKLSEAGFQAIRNFDGLRLQAYKCPAGIWTIGYGSTYFPDGSKVKPGDKLKDHAEAEALLHHTVESFIAAVNQLVMVPINQNQGDALTSFAFNEGTHALGTSTLLKLLNQGHYQDAADQFLRWTKIKDPKTGEMKDSEDLVLRRKRERLIFLKPVL